MYLEVVVSHDFCSIRPYVLPQVGSRSSRRPPAPSICTALRANARRNSSRDVRSSAAASLSISLQWLVERSERGVVDVERQFQCSLGERRPKHRLHRQRFGSDAVIERATSAARGDDRKVRIGSGSDAAGCFGCRLELDVLESLTDPRVEQAGDRLKLRLDCLAECRRRTDALLVDRDAEVLVQAGIELDLAAPPVVVVLLALAAHKVPAARDLTTCTQDGDAAAADDADATFGDVVEVMPAVNWEHGEPHRHD